jgi:hypothetical protein
LIHFTRPWFKNCHRNFFNFWDLNRQPLHPKAGMLPTPTRPPLSERLLNHGI